MRTEMDRQIDPFTWNSYTRPQNRSLLREVDASRRGKTVVCVGQPVREITAAVLLLGIDLIVMTAPVLSVPEKALTQL
jgi:hypothetical protein